MFFQLSFAQEEKLIQGKIIVADATPLGIVVLNLVTEKETATDAEGRFSILAKPDDLLVFYASNLDKQRKIIERSDYEKRYIEITMTSKVEQLEEVEIIRQKIDAVSLGILSKPAKKYTPAERRLYASQSSPLDSFLNFISGRRDLLHDDVATEKKEFALAMLANLYADTFYTETLKIKKEFIRGFQYYVVENKKFTDALQGENQFLINLIVIDLAREYNELHSYDKY